MAVGFSGASGDTLTRTTNLFATANFSACIFARVGNTGGYITPLGMWGSSEILLQFGSASPEIYNGGVVCNSANSYSLNDWVFLGMVANGTDNSGDEWALFDGLANAAAALTKTNGSRSSSFTPTTFRVGQSNYGEEMNGALVGLKVWTASLTDAEIELERRQLAPVRTANLWGFFPLLNTSDKLKDFGGNGYDLTNGTGPWTEEANPPVRWRAGHRKPVYVSAGGGATEYSRTASLGAVVQAEQAKTASLSAVLQASDSRTASLSALIRAEGLLASSLSALIQAELQRSASLNAVVQAALERTTSLSAVLQVAQALSTGASAVIQSEGVRSSALSAIVQAALSGTANLSAVVQAELSQATSLDAIITATGSGLLTASLSALIQAEGLRTASLSAVVQAAISATASLSAVVQAEGSQTSNLSAVVQAEGQRAATLSGVVQAEGAKSANLSAVLQAALALSASLDAVVVLGGGGGAGALSTSLNAVIADALLARWRMAEGPDVTDGLVARWACDDVDLGQLADAQGAMPLTVVGSLPLVGGRHGSARAFVRGDPYYLAANYATGPAPDGIVSGAFSLCAWLRPAHTPAPVMNGTVVGLTANPGGYSSALLQLQHRPGLGDVTFYWYFSTGGPGGVAFESKLSCPVVLTTDQWTHLTVTYAGAGSPQIFVDGQLLAGTVETTIAGGGTEASWRRPSAFPSWNMWVGALNGYWDADGDLDEVRIYNRALDAAEVAQLAGLPALQFLDDQGVAHLEPVCGPLPTVGKLGRGRAFFSTLEDGLPESRCRGETPGAMPASISSALRGPYTVCGWVRRQSDDVPQGVFVASGDVSGQPEEESLLEILLGHSPSNAPEAVWVWGDSVADFYGGSVPLGVWTHVAVRHAPSGSGFAWELLVNGLAVASATGPAPAATRGQNARLALGAELWPGIYALNGALDDWRLYQRALTDAELAVIARGGAGVRKVNTLNAGASSAAVESGGRGATITDDGRRNWRDDG